MLPDARSDTPAPGAATGGFARLNPSVWRVPVIALATVAALLVLAFSRDWAEMAGQWWNSSTYNHILFVPPVIGWLVHQRWPQLRQLTPSTWWPGLALFGAALLLWVLGSFGAIALVRQAGIVAMLGAAVLALLGPRVGAGLSFPLAYLVFLVPFGDELVPPLQLVTAKLAIALVQLSQVPAAIDGVFIDTPAGLFEVAEACSGIEFLIAMVAIGALAGHVCFRSWPRRGGFMLFAVAVPVLANGVRAWGTIYIAQFKGAAFAGGLDHIVYGWIFFAAVIALVFAAGWPFFDRASDAPLVDVPKLQSSPALARLAAQTIRMPVLLAVMAALVIAGQGWAFAANRLAAPVPRQIDLPQVPGWHRVDYRPALWWEPRASGADHRLLGRYADDQGNAVDVFYALYSSQSEGRKAGGFGEGALTANTAWAWRAPGPGAADAKSDVLLGRGAVERLTETYYRTGALLTGSNVRLKLANIAGRLALRKEPTMLLILSAERQPGHDPARATAAFRAATGPLGPWMDRIAGLR